MYYIFQNGFPALSFSLSLSNNFCCHCHILWNGENSLQFSSITKKVIVGDTIDDSLEILFQKATKMQCMKQTKEPKDTDLCQRNHTAGSHSYSDCCHSHHSWKTLVLALAASIVQLTHDRGPEPNPLCPPSCQSPSGASLSWLTTQSMSLAAGSSCPRTWDAQDARCEGGLLHLPHWTARCKVIYCLYPLHRATLPILQVTVCAERNCWKRNIACGCIITDLSLNIPGQ